MSERWSQIERLYHAARELGPAERAAFLEQACPADAAVRQEVESLLANGEDDDEFLETPALRAVAEVLEAVTASRASGDSSLVGKTISHYRIVAELGRGGMGVVYKAEDMRLGRPVALKFLREGSAGFGAGSPGGSPAARALERFRREARAASALNHPNICTVHDVGQHEGTPFIVMEYIEGRTLKQCIEDGLLQTSTVIDLAIQIADALASAHAKGIVHRDIKPTNILVTASGQAKILDFGLAKPQPKDREQPGAGTTSSAAPAASLADPSLTNPGTAVGTVAYMSPEQARGEELDARSDLFSFGTVLYEMSSRRNPFAGDSVSAILHRIVAEQPMPLGELNPQAPPELERIVNKALEKDRDLRFQSAAELRTDLKRLRRDSSADRSPAAGVSKARAKGGILARLVHRWRLAAVLATAAAVGVLGWLQLRPLPLPRIGEYKQLTNDGVMKTLVATDGVRLYLNESSGAARWVTQMAVNGGEPARLPMPSPLFLPFDVSPDGTNVLAAEISTYGEGPLWIAPVLGNSPYRVGNLEASSGAWSPDGRQVAYARRGELFVAQNDGSGVRKLGEAPGEVRRPAWSPDGKRIRFTAADEARHSEALWEVSVQGLAAHPLFPKQDATNRCCGRWTPDGRYFVFSQAGQIWVLPEARGIVRRGTPQPVQLTSGAIAFDEALPSKDGKRLFATGYAPRGEPVRYDAQRRSFVPLLPGISADFVASSKDGKWIAYVTFPEGVLWRSRADQSERVQLTQPSANSYPVLPRWSPDGTRVLYGVGASRQLTRAYIVPSCGGQSEELSAGANQGIVDPNWSADGKRICYSGDHGAATRLSRPNIHVLDLQSRQATDVPGSEEYFSPRWSPDGRYLAALSLDSSRLGVFDFSTGKWQDVGRAGFFSFPCWSHDGRAIYYVQGTVNPAVMRIRLEGRGAERVADLRDIHLTGFYGFSLSLTPDDQPILTRDAGAEEVFALDWKER